MTWLSPGRREEGKVIFSPQEIGKSKGDRECLLMRQIPGTAMVSLQGEGGAERRAPCSSSLLTVALCVCVAFEACPQNEGLAHLQYF